MTNADKFKNIFGLYATELWSMPEKDFLKWLNSEAMNCSEIPNNSDLISRQAAIDALRKMQTYKMFSGDDMLLIDQAGAQTELMQLPPIQPEIVRCEECKYHYQRNCPIEKYFSLDGFCSRGDRGTT